MKRWGFSAVLAAALLVAGCAGESSPVPAQPPTSAALTATSASTVAAAAWSNEAVTACRTFVNAVPNMALVESQIRQYKPTMTAQELSVAKTGWGLATASTTIPATIGNDAEPEVHQALAAVSAALGTSITSPDYVRVNAEAYSGAIDVCTKVGVIA